MKKVDGFEWLKIITSKKKVLHQFNIIDGNPDYASSLCGMLVKTDDLIRGNETAVPCKKCLTKVEERAGETIIDSLKVLAEIQDGDNLQQVASFYDDYDEKELAVREGNGDALSLAEEIDQHITNLSLLVAWLDQQLKCWTEEKADFQRKRDFFQILAEVRKIPRTKQ